MFVKNPIIKYICFALMTILVFTQIQCPPKTVIVKEETTKVVPVVDYIYVPVPGDKPPSPGPNVKSIEPITSGSAGNERFPAVSRDGKYITYLSCKTTKSGDFVSNDIYVMESNGRNSSQITNTIGEQDAFYPYWLGENRIVYIQDDEPDIKCPNGIYYQYYPAQTLGGYPLLTRESKIETFGNCKIRSAHPSPDGKKLAVCLEEEYGRVTKSIFRQQPLTVNPKILIIDISENRPKKPEFFAYGQDPAWSPDGKSIAFSQKSGDNFFICVRDLETMKQRQLTQGFEANDWMPCWSPSGKEIAFSRYNPETGWDIMKMNASDGSNLIQLTNSKGTEWDPSWGPGGFIYFSLLLKPWDWDIWKITLNP